MNQSTDLEYLLKLKEQDENKIVTHTNLLKEAKPLQADKSATLEDLIEMISMLVNKTMKKQNVVFVPDEGARIRIDQKESLDKSYIFYEVISREPILEKKPRYREEITENTNSNPRTGMILGQKFKSLIQFNILSCDYKTANTVMNTLESLLFRYTAFFKKNGVSEFLFRNQITDQNLNYYRQSLSVRSLIYSVIVEKLYTQFKTDIQDIQID